MHIPCLRSGKIIAGSLGLLYLAMLPVGVSARTETYQIGDRISGGLLLQNERGDSYYVRAGKCLLFEGDTVYIDTDDYGSPAYANRLYKHEAKTDVDCTITDIHRVTGRIPLVKALKTNGEAIVNFKNEDFLIEYGIACRTTIQNYTSQEIFLDLDGAFDGVADNLVLPNGVACSISKTQSLGKSTTRAGLSPCPAHAHGNPKDLNTCVCNQGYELNNDMTACKAVMKCPDRSTGTWGNCTCDKNYLMLNNACVTYSQTCKDQLGKHALGDKKNCYCEAGYVLNGKRNYCVKNSSNAGKKAIEKIVCGVLFEWRNGQCRPINP